LIQYLIIKLYKYNNSEDLLAARYILASCLAYSSNLDMEETCFSKTSVDFQRTLHGVARNLACPLEISQNPPKINLWRTIGRERRIDGEAAISCAHRMDNRPPKQFCNTEQDTGKGLDA
jgi:hypothetical protein